MLYYTVYLHVMHCHCVRSENTKLDSSVRKCVKCSDVASYFNNW